MKLEIEIKVSRPSNYSIITIVTQKKEIEISELGCVKTARNAIDRITEEFLTDLKPVQVKAEEAEALNGKP